MDPARTCCSNPACAARGQTGQGHIGIQSCTEQRCICPECRQTFTATQGIAMDRLRTAAATVSRVVTLMAHGCPLPAIVVAFGSDERTVARWLARAGGQGQAVQAHLVEQPRDLGQVQKVEAFTRCTSHPKNGYATGSLWRRPRCWSCSSPPPASRAGTRLYP